MQLPRKLKKDAIAEALCEVRFESQELPELAVGKLAAQIQWKNYAPNRLPASDIPGPIRSQDPSLRNQPILELRSPERHRLVKVGSNVLSYHVIAPYCGWERFRIEIDEVLDHVFTSLDGFRALRLGFRYINALTADDHLIPDVTALNCNIDVAGQKLDPQFNLNYRRQKSDTHFSLVRIASPDFVSGRINIAMNALVDVDIFTPDAFETRDILLAKRWMVEAHDFEKEEFFSLLPASILEKLVEE